MPGARAWRAGFGPLTWEKKYLGTAVLRSAVGVGFFMPRGLRRFHESAQSHFLTFSCYCRQAHFTSLEIYDLFVLCLEDMRRRFAMGVYEYVVCWSVNRSGRRAAGNRNHRNRIRMDDEGSGNKNQGRAGERDIPPATAARPVAFSCCIPPKELNIPIMSGMDRVQVRTVPQRKYFLLR